MKNMRATAIKILILTLFLLQFPSLSISTFEGNHQVELYIRKIPNSKNTVVQFETLELQVSYEYHDLSELYAELEYFNQTASNLIDYSFIGFSYWNNPIPLITLTNEKIGDELKAKTYVVAHHHAREQISIEHSIRTIRDLVNGYYSADQKISDLLDRAILYFIVTLNPDSLNYTLYKDPWQRKNMRPIDDDNDGDIDEDGPNDVDGDGYVSIYSAAYATGGWETWLEGNDTDGDGKVDEDAGGGVDLNRNYPIHWNDSNCDSGSTGNTLDEDYPGSAALSENETKALVNFVIQHNFTHALSLHSGTTIPILGWGYTTEKQAENTLYEQMLNHWQSEQLLPESFFDPTNTDVDYTVAGDWGDWNYVTQHIIPLTLEIYESTGTDDWRFYDNNGTHNIYESDVVFFTPPENQIENVHRELYEFEEHWLGLTPSIQVEETQYTKSEGKNKITISLKSGSQYFNTTDNAKVEVRPSIDSINTDYPESIGTLFPTNSTELPILLSEDIPDKFTLYVNVTSEYASDLQLELYVSASNFKSAPGFSGFIAVSSFLVLLVIFRKRR
ncbi:MAG: M14 family zinc carboxypeptidase [Candidatus Hodarchaeota archaeon]